MAEPGDAGSDPGGVQAAIDRYRDLAKYLITIFAGVGALLIAGTQLASIGDLSFEDEPERVFAVIAGLVLAVTAIAAVVGLALRVLRPVDMTFDDVIADPELRARIESRRSLLGGATSVEEVQANLETSALSEEDRESWYAVADAIIARAAYLRARDTFEASWWPLLGAGIVGVIGITAFTWGANPPADSPNSPVVDPTPVEVEISLTAAGREALAGALGGEDCANGPIAALTIGGAATEPKVVTLPEGSCTAAQFVLSPDWGAATSPR